MSDRPQVNWIQVFVNFLTIIIPLAIAIIVWGSSIEIRLTKLESTAATTDTLVSLAKDVEWIRLVQLEVLDTQQRTLQALNEHMQDHRDGAE